MKTKIEINIEANELRARLARHQSIAADAVAQMFDCAPGAHAFWRRRYQAAHENMRAIEAKLDAINQPVFPI